MRKRSRTVKKNVANKLIKTNENRLKFKKIIQRLNVARIRTRSLALANNSENFNLTLRYTQHTHTHTPCQKTLLIF